MSVIYDEKMDTLLNKLAFFKDASVYYLQKGDLEKQAEYIEKIKTQSDLIYAYQNSRA